MGFSMDKPLLILPWSFFQKTLLVRNERLHSESQLHMCLFGKPRYSCIRVRVAAVLCSIRCIGEVQDRYCNCELLSFPLTGTARSSIEVASQLFAE